MGERLREAGADPNAVQVLHNWAPAWEPGTTAPAHNSFQKHHALEGKSVVLYSGNFGRAHLFDELVAAAVALQDEDGIEFILVGSGSQAGHLADQVCRHRLAHMRILPPVPLDRLAEVLDCATIGIVTQKAATVGLLVPSKLYGLMAAARPVLFVGPQSCEAACIIRAAGCGYIIDPGDSAGMARAIRELVADPEKAINQGLLGRAWLSSHGTRSQAVERFSNLLGDIRLPLPFEHRKRQTSPVAAWRLRKPLPARMERIL
jgi:colanic acid biosynthesis glycosyl transferase WcaI